MNTTLLSIAAALTLSALSVAHAAEPSVQIKGTNKFLMMQEDFTDFKNTYQLTNGQQVGFSQRMNSFFVQVDGGERVRIYPVSRKAFITEAGTRIEFRDNAETVAIVDFDRLPMVATLPAGTVMMAQR